MNIAQLRTYQDKTVIPNITVTVEKAFAPKPTKKEGVNAYSYKVKDETGECYCKFFSNEQPSMQEGQTVTLSSVPGKNGALKGVNVNVWDNQHSIQCSESAKVEGGQGSQTQATTVSSTKTETYNSGTTSKKKNLDEISNEFLKIYATTRQKAEGAGIAGNEAHDIGLKAIECVPLFWFGEKGIE